MSFVWLIKILKNLFLEFIFTTNISYFIFGLIGLFSSLFHSSVKLTTKKEKRRRKKCEIRIRSRGDNTSFLLFRKYLFSTLNLKLNYRTIITFPSFTNITVAQ